MDITLRQFWRLKPQTILNSLRNWKRVFSIFEKSLIVLLLLVIILTSYSWVVMASSNSVVVARAGGSANVGVTAPDGPGNLDLGRLTQSGLVKFSSNGQITADLAKNWKISDDKLVYTFELVDQVSASDIIAGFAKRPADFPKIKPEIVSLHQVKITIDAPKASFLSELANPIFPYGPYKVDKESEKDIILSRNKSYFGEKPFLDKIDLKLYADQAKLLDAAKSKKIDIASNMIGDLPSGWQKRDYKTNTMPMLFVNSSKSYLKKPNVRKDLLSGKKADKLSSLDVLEITDGAPLGQGYLNLVKSWKDAGLEVRERKENIQTALTGSLLKRDYDLVYIVIDSGYEMDPYNFYNSNERNGTGQNFAEFADAEIDKATVEARGILDPVQRTAKYNEIFKQIDDLGVTKIFEPIQINLAYNPKVKGIGDVACFTQSDLLCSANQWYVKTQKK